MKELLPCPFCDSADVYDSDDTNYSIAECQDCGASHHTTMWNTRPVTRSTLNKKALDALDKVQYQAEWVWDSRDCEVIRAALQSQVPIPDAEATEVIYSAAKKMRNALIFVYPFILSYDRSADIRTRQRLADLEAVLDDAMQAYDNAMGK